MSLNSTQRRIFGQALLDGVTISPKKLFNALKGVEGIEYEIEDDPPLAAVTYTNKAGLAREFRISHESPKRKSRERKKMSTSLTVDRDAKHAIRDILRDNGCHVK